jgi:hypothetical protein
VLFAHALLVHSGGINEGDAVRLAVINDFQRVRPKTTLMWQVEDACTPHTQGAQVIQPDGTVPFPPEIDMDSAGDKRCKLIWHHDSIEFAEPRPTQLDMWSGFAFTEGPATVPPQGVVPDPAGPWWEKYDSVRRYGVQTPILRLRDIATLDTQKGVWKIDEAMA